MWFKRMSEQGVRKLAALFSATSLLLAAALVGTCLYIYRLMELYSPARVAVLPNPPASPLQVHYELDLPGRGEIFPALATGSPSDTWPVAVLTIVNASNRPLLQTVSAEILEWSRRSAITVIVGPHETRAIRISPELLPQAYQNNEIRRAMLDISASGPADTSGYAQTCPVYLHSVSDLYWGRKFANAQFIARWVTPHDPAVIQLVASARKYVARGRLAGYDLPNGDGSQKLVKAQVRTEARAVFEAMRRLRITYVDSMYTFGNFTTEAERVRLPRETLLLSSANCIDVSVAFASAMENLGIDPVIVIVPGHAFAGVRLGPDSRQVLYLDLTVLPDGTFDQAISRAGHWLEKTPPARVLAVDVAAVRALGIYPIPDPASQRS
jgi:hypothetical protein